MNTLQHIQSYTKTEFALKNFLNYLINEKIYDTKMLTMDLKDNDHNNILLVAATYQLWPELQTLISHVDKSVFDYQNKEGVTLGQFCLQNPDAYQVVKQIWEMNKESFYKKPSFFNLQFNICRSPLVADIHLDVCVNHIEKMYFINPQFFKLLVEKRGYDCLYSVNKPEVAYRVFYIYCDFKNNYPSLADDDKVLDILSKIIDTKKEQVLSKTSFLQNIFSNNSLSNKSFFVKLINTKPQVISKLGLNFLDNEKNSFLHTFVNYCPKTLDSDHKVILDMILNNCHHYNTQNNNKKDAYSIAIEQQKNDFAEHLRSFIEKKIMSNSLILSNTKTSKKPNKL